MSQRDWKPHIERLRAEPGDAEALDALEAYLAERERARVEGVRQTGSFLARAGRLSLKLFLGKVLYDAVVRAWDAWSSYFYGTYQSETPSAWPEAEVRDLTAAMAARFIRIGLFGIFIGLIPAILLGFQTSLMLIQVWQVNVQNEIIKEQNALTREQFGVGYRTQLTAQLYAADCSDASDRSTCKPTALPGVRAEAARALVKLDEIQRGAEGEPSARLVGAWLDDVRLVEADFRGTNFDEASFRGAVLERSNFVGASFEGADFTSATIEESDFTDARLIKPTFERALLQGSDFTGAIFYPADRPVMRDRDDVPDFSTARALKDLTFKNANLIKARFDARAVLRVDFSGAKLVQSSFAGAKVTKSTFTGADLTGANFTGATLVDVDLTGATLDEAKMRDVTMRKVTCPDGKKSEAKGGKC